MLIKFFFSVIAVSLLICFPPSSTLAQDRSTCSSQLSESWQTSKGMHAPESVLFDPLSRILLVANVNGHPLAKDGNGTIAKMALHGVLLDEKWITGLNAPKGMALGHDTLYVADIDELVAIDWTNGTKQRYPAAGAIFLNDVIMDNQGHVYVSDMMTNTIYRLAGDRLELWLQSNALPGPNGLFIQKDSLYVACWGEITDGFKTSTAGHIKKVSLLDKSITSLGSGLPLGNLDGLETDHCGGFWVTDHMAGTLMQIDASGKLLQTIEVGQGCADIEMLPVDWELLIVPMMSDNKLRGFTIK